MNSEPRHFSERPGSSRGLTARPYLANGSIMLRQHVSGISYTVTNLTDGGDVTGTLDQATVILTTPVTPWYVDDIGYTFLWEAPGTLWPTANKEYFIDVAITADGKVYKIAWQVKTARR